MQQNAVLSPTKRSAISCKMQCYLLQNAVLNAAKRNVECCFLHFFEEFMIDRMTTNCGDFE